MTAPGAPPRHIVRSKLVPPPIASNVAVRPRVLELLDRDARCTLISAMPGFGKTVAVQQWVETLDLPVAWLSLDLLDLEPMTFWSHLLAALRTAVPGIGGEPELLLRERGVEDLVFLGALVTRLDERRQPLMLVLDGLTEHVDRLALEGLVTLVERAGGALRLVATTRADPPLPLAQWRSRGWLRELRETDLRLTDVEALAVAQRAVTVISDPDEVFALNRRVDGWPIALHMALLSRPPTTTSGGRAGELGTGSDRLLADYLVAEVLESLGDDERDVALALSVLEWFDPAMCEALVGPQSSVIGRLVGRGMFLSVLDPRTGAMRFHALFRQLMEMELGWRDPARRIELHRRAASIWRARGDLTAAYHHLSAIGESEGAHALLIDPALQLVDDGDLAALRRFARQLPAPQAVTNPAMALDLAVVALYAEGTPAARRWCERAEGLLASTPGADEADPAEIAARLHGIRCVASLLEADLDTALAGVAQHRRHPTTNAFERRFPVVAARVMLASRRADQADRWITAAERLTEPPIVVAVTAPTLRAWHDWLFGRLDRAIERVEPAVSWMDDHGIGAHHLAIDTLITGAWCRLGAGDIAGAVNLSTRAMADADVLGAPWNQLQAGYLAARCELVTGDPARALRAIDDLRSVVSFDSCRSYADRLLGLEIEARASRGEHDELGPLIDHLEPGPRADVLRARFVSTDDDLAALDVTDRRGWPVVERVQADVVLAARRSRTGHENGDLAAIVTDCARSGWVLPFLGLGPRIDRLLHALPLDELHPDLERTLRELTPADPDASVAGAPSLTTREITLLDLLPTHLSYAEMGATLYLSVNTVKSNLKALYRKLGATTRAEAVEHGRRHGLL